jgi:hypothetical protein
MRILFFPAQLNRLPAVGATDTNRASTPGISEARFMASDTAAIAAFGRLLYERESKYYSSLGRPPPLELLLEHDAFSLGHILSF